MAEVLKGLDDFFAAGYTPEDLVRYTVPADVYLGDFESCESFERDVWVPPTSLDASPVPRFPIEALPDSIRAYAWKLSIATQTPLALTAGVALGATSIALAKKIEVEPRPGWVEPVVIWVLILLPSGERKTAVMTSMRRPLDEWQRGERRELNPLVAEAESRREILVRRKNKAEQDAAKSNLEDDERYAAEVARELAEHEVPSVPQLTTSDVTAEAAAMLCAENDGRIGVWSDEGETVKIIAGRYSRNQSPDVEIFLKGHAGGYYSSSRASRAGFSLRDPAIPMVLSLQPEFIRGLANQRTLHGQGFFARYLYSLPPSALGGRKSRPEPVDEESYENYSRVIKVLLNIGIPKNEFGEAEPRTLQFSEAADELLEDFQDWVEPQLAPSGALASFREWGSKLPGAVVRIAGLLHAAEKVSAGDQEPWEVPLERSVLKKAIEVGCYYLEHTRAVMHEMGADPRIEAARHVLGVFQKEDISKISKRDLFQKVRWDSRFGTMDDLDPVVDLLKEYGYVRELEVKRRGPGRPKSNTLEVNPLRPTRNSLNTRNPSQGRMEPFFEWLEDRRGPEDPEDPPSSDSSLKPDPDGHHAEESQRIHPADGSGAHESDVGEEINQKDGYEGPAGSPPSETHHQPSVNHQPSVSYELITGEARLLELAAFLREVEEVELDLETTGLSPFDDRVRLISLHAGDRAYLVDCFEVDPAPALEAMKDKVLYVHGAEFDLPFLYHAYGFTPTRTPIDTLHLSQMVRAGEWERKQGGRWERRKHSLQEALERELGVKLGSKKEYQRPTAWTGEIAEGHLDYAASDVEHLKPLADKLFALLEERELKAVWDLEQRAKPLFLEMCYEGIPFDKERWEELADELEEKVRELKECADARAPRHPDGGTWNWFSPKQAKEAFGLAGFDIPDLKRETLSAYEGPFVRAVSEYRDAKNELSRARKWYQGRYSDGRVHPHWRPCGAATGRASCTDPNVQSLTTAGEYRNCVRPKDGRVLVKADVNQMELRVLAAVTGDETMLDVFRRGGDVNINTAEAITGRKVEKGDPERQRAKAVNFGLSYGMGAQRFLEKAKNEYGVLMSLQEAKEAKRKLLDTYPGIGHWHRRQSRECQRGNFETRTLLGRRRVVEPDHEGKPKFTERLNAPVQGTGADILKTAMANLWERREEYPDALPILTVHDEIVVECDAAKAEGVDAWLSTAIRDAISGVLGYPELAGEEAVETIVIDAWGDG